VERGRLLLPEALRRFEAAARVISGIVLAAGTGSRFGGTKQLAEIDGIPLVLHAVAALREGGVDEIVVVTGHDADAVEAVLPAEVSAVRNTSFRDGQATSLAAAIHALDERSEAAVVLMADQPGIVGTDVRALIETFRTTRARIARFPLARIADGIMMRGRERLVGSRSRRAAR
jgi:molybdenum cofactor cytidylyltransferase